MKYVLIFLAGLNNHEVIGKFPDYETCTREARFQIDQYKTGSWSARFPKYACILDDDNNAESRVHNAQ